MEDMTETAVGQPTEGAALPTFRKPPVVEVALAVAFEPLEGLHSGEMWRLHQLRYKEAGFPTVEEQPPLVVQIERFGRTTRMPDIRFEVLEKLPSPRLWFLDETGTQLVQIQQDWFARNWRRTEDDPEYRRYPSIRQPFEEDLDFLFSFVQDSGFGTLKPVQCEVTYTNEVRPAEGVWSDHGDLSTVMRIWRDDFARDSLPKPEEGRLEVIYPMTRDGAQVGRLRVQLQPAFTAAEELPVYLLHLTARGTPVNGDVDGILRFMDEGHVGIVRAFENITSDAMHEVWEKTL